MPIRTILAIVQGESDAGRVSDCAAALAERHEAHLIGLHSEALPIAYTSSMGFPDAEFIRTSSEQNHARAETLGALFLERAAAVGVSAEWRSMESFSGDSAQTAISAARSCDLVVATQADPEGSTPDLDGLLFDAGRPVLVTPHDGPALSSFRRVIVAWNGSREAARAAFDALPFILEATSTEILMIDPPQSRTGAEPGTEIAAALSRHGAEVTVHTAASGGLTEDTVIRNRLAATGADLLVLGAYSHSWLRELLFGGVTRSVLQSMPVTALMSR